MKIQFFGEFDLSIPNSLRFCHVFSDIYSLHFEVESEGLFKALIFQLSVNYENHQTDWRE